METALQEHQRLAAMSFVGDYHAAVREAQYDWAMREPGRVLGFVAGIVAQIDDPQMTRAAWITGKYRQQTLTALCRRWKIRTNNDLRATLAPLCTRCLLREAATFEVNPEYYMPPMHGKDQCNG